MLRLARFVLALLLLAPTALVALLSATSATGAGGPPGLAAATLFAAAADASSESADPLDVDDEEEDDEAEEEEDDEDDEDDFDFEDEEDDYDDVLDGGAVASDDAIFSIVFPGKGADKSFAAGSKVEAVVGFQNAGKGSFTIGSIEAYFRHPQDPSIIVQNFSAVAYNTTVAAGEEHSFAYDFVPNDRFRSGDMYKLDVAVTYVTAEGGKIFKSAAFNETVGILDPVDYLDNQTWLALAATTIGAVIAAYYYFKDTGLKSYEIKSKSKKGSVEKGTESFDDDYLPREYQTRK